MVLRIVPVMALVLTVVLGGHFRAAAAEPSLTITLADKTSKYTASELLQRSDKVTLTIPADVAYKASRTYTAVPLLNLLGPRAGLTFDTLEARATDGFVSQLAMAAVLGAEQGRSVAFIAVEPPAKPWPKLPGKEITAGPFFLVWQHPERSKIGPEQWPYALAELRAVRSPMQRWPQMRVADKGPAQRGMQVYVKHCLSCHRIDGAGEATMGPDMVRPMSPLDYMTDKGLRALVRDPASVRKWPQQQMSGFGKDVLSDAGLDDLIAYLAYMRDK